MEKRSRNIRKREAYEGLMTVSEGKNDPEILYAIEELEPASETDFDRRINSLLTMRMLQREWNLPQHRKYCLKPDSAKP